MKLFNNPDGADAQSRAVLAYLSQGDGIEESWDDERGSYKANPTVARWHNCREQGYVVSMISDSYVSQINIAFFEHRNSDCICAVRWTGKTTINPPTIESAEFDDIYKDKWDVSHSVNYGEAFQMAEWIKEQLIEFWVKTANPERATK